MHDSICVFPSKRFYNNQLQSMGTLVPRPAPASVFRHSKERVVWIDCDTPHQLGRVTQVRHCGRLFLPLAKCSFCSLVTLLEFLFLKVTDC